MNVTRNGWMCGQVNDKRWTEVPVLWGVWGAKGGNSRPLSASKEMMGGKGGAIE